MAKKQGKIHWGKPREKKFVPGCTGLVLTAKQRTTIMKASKGLHPYGSPEDACSDGRGGRRGRKGPQGHS